MRPLFEQTFPAATEALVEVRARVRAACRDCGCGEECTGQTVLAVNEACMNIIQHGYRFAAGRHFRISLSENAGVLAVRLLDNGLPAADSDLRPRALDDLRPGGLGVRFMREAMDTVEYLPPPDGFANLLQMTKRID